MTSLGQLPSYPQPAEPQDQIEASSVLENGTDPSTTFYTKLGRNFPFLPIDLDSG